MYSRLVSAGRPLDLFFFAVFSVPTIHSWKMAETPSSSLLNPVFFFFFLSASVSPSGGLSDASPSLSFSSRVYLSVYPSRPIRNQPI